jgi:quercetin dioxygenase-like cupin family protein
MSVTHLAEDKLWATFPNTRGMVLARGERLIMYYIEYDPNMTFPMHSHPHEQVGYCVSGEGEIGIGSAVHVIGPGCGYHIPSNEQHYERNTGNGPLICVDIFSPVREDLASKHFNREYFREQE